MTSSAQHVAGIDGFKGGWVAVVLRAGRYDRAVVGEGLQDVMALLHDAASIAIDIPIGSELGRFRRVDLAAKAFVGPRERSVFLMPPLEVFNLATYADACARCRTLTNAAPSKQAWELRAKILEAARVAQHDSRVIEVHPEVSFRALSGAPLLHGKKTWSGQVARRAALAGAGIELPDEIGPAGEAAPDDVLDAAVAAWSAHRHASQLAQTLGPDVADPSGRRVTIWY